MLKFNINAKNVDESNAFLRKLWCELNSVRPIGWIAYPYKKENRIIIGKTNFGEISFDYAVKGCIKTLYINLRNEEEAPQIQAAVQHALSCTFQPFSVSVTLVSNKRVAYVSNENISIFSLEILYTNTSVVHSQSLMKTELLYV